MEYIIRHHWWFNHVGNLCSAPVLADHENDELLYQSSYYYIGHFSRFIKPGAQRIHFEANDPLLEMTVFKILMENPEWSNCYCLHE